MKFENLKIVELANGLKVVNASPHPCTVDNDGDILDIPPCGIALNSTVREKLVCKENGVEFVTTFYEKEDEGVEFISFIEENHPDVLILGDTIAAQTYPGVANLVPVPGAVSGDRTKRIDKFTIYPRRRINRG